MFGVTVKNVIQDKIFCKQIKKEQKGLIITIDTPIFEVLMVSDEVEKYLGYDLKPGEKIIINKRANQFVYNDKGEDYFLVRTGDIISIVEDDDL